MSNGSDQLTARLVLHRENKGWILEKIANRLAENLSEWNVTADISDSPSRGADINHWMLYMHCQGEYWPGSTMMITHVDSASQYLKLKGGLDVVDVGICMSRMMVDYLARQGIPRRKLSYITPGHDGIVSPRRIVIGITTRLYADGRKREFLLQELAKSKRLDAFHFEIFGDGWERIIPSLESAGATVEHFPSCGDHERDYELVIERIKTFDYYLYTGLDEGSMGFLDALATGVPTIVTPQGFHLDVEGGLVHSFETGGQLREIFERVSRARDSYIDSVKDLTWDKYAGRHALLWREILGGEMNKLENLPTAPLSNKLGSRQVALQDVLVTGRFYWAGLLNRFRRLVRKV